ncbi:MAG: hypothetical protein M1482_13890, partial [Chloroflexi bacterium]|nr:hypothetical protein [Chloroflexota bacterium]
WLILLLSCFCVFLLGLQLTGKRAAAFAAALLFALLPVHAEAISFTAARYDPLAGLLYFLSLSFFILALSRRRLDLYLISLGAFILALSSKETAVTLPLILVCYELLFRFPSRSEIPLAVMRYVPFGAALAGRMVWFGHGYTGLSFAPPEGWDYWVDNNLLRVVDPLTSDPSAALRWTVLGLAIALLLVFRFRRDVVFAAVWIPITLIPTIVGGVSDRSFYIPSFGVCVLIAVGLDGIWSQRIAALRLVGVAGLAGTALAYGSALFVLNQAYDRAGQVAYAIPQRVESLYPSLPNDPRLVFVGVPDKLPEGPLVYITGLRNALQLQYDRPDVRVFKYAKFPIWLDNLSGLYFFQVDHRAVADRRDLVQVLEDRKRCDDFSRLDTSWSFSSDAQGWEPWNQLSGFSVQDASLAAHSDGANPIMASPAIDVPALTIGDIGIVMQVSSGRPEMHGKVYWLATDQADFSPGLVVPFLVHADGEFHTYRVDLAGSNQLLMGDHIQRLRLDPVDGPADIQIKAIDLYSHCSGSEGMACQCP